MFVMIKILEAHPEYSNGLVYKENWEVSNLVRVSVSHLWRYRVHSSAVFIAFVVNQA